MYGADCVLREGYVAADLKAFESTDSSNWRYETCSQRICI